MTQAIILAGGLGTRLRSLVKDVPKPMALIHGKPFLSHLLEEIRQQGMIHEVILSVSYKHEVISEYFGDVYKDLPLKYAVEPQPLGTGGAIKNCARWILPGKPLFVFNGDSFSQLSHKDMYACHSQGSSLITLAVKKMPDCYRYGRVILSGTNHILSFDAAGSPGEGYINAGVYLLDARLFEDFPEPPFSFEKDFLLNRVHRLIPNSYFFPGYFIDIGIPEDYIRAAQFLK